MAKFTWQPERTDLPLLVIPVNMKGMVTHFQQALPMLTDVARVEMYDDYTLDQDVIAQRCAEADMIIAIDLHINDALLDRLENVRAISFGGTGVASYIDLERCADKGIRVMNVLHYGNHAVGEHAIALLFELARHVGNADMRMHNGVWEGHDSVELFGKTIGLIGFGGIAQVVAQIALGIGMKVVTWNNHIDADLARSMGVSLCDSLQDVIAESDVVSVHLPYIPATAGIIDAECLSHLRSGAMIVNTARSQVFATGALEERLAQGDVLAALDVFDEEPLPSHSPLRQLDNVVLTPHMAWRADGAYRNIVNTAVENVRNYCENNPTNVVV